MSYLNVAASLDDGASLPDNQIEEIEEDQSLRGKLWRLLSRVVPAEILHPDATQLRLLLLSKAIRLFSFGFLAVMLVTYLSTLGLTEAQIGLLFTLTLLGDAAISLLVTSHADKVGRRRMLLLGGALSVLTSLVFAFTASFPLLVLAATLGVISPSGNEVGVCACVLGVLVLCVVSCVLCDLVGVEKRLFLVGFERVPLCGLG